MSLSYTSPSPTLQRPLSMATLTRKRNRMVANAIDMDRDTIRNIKAGQWPVAKIVGIGELKGAETEVCLVPFAENSMFDWKLQCRYGCSMNGQYGNWKTSLFMIL